jgi:hypothetical protein
MNERKEWKSKTKKNQKTDGRIARARSSTRRNKGGNHRVSDKIPQEKKKHKTRPDKKKTI